MMKIPMETKAMKWEDYFEQNSTALGLSKAVAEAVDDSVVEAVDTQVMHQQHMFPQLFGQKVSCFVPPSTYNR